MTDELQQNGTVVPLAGPLYPAADSRELGGGSLPFTSCHASFSFCFCLDEGGTQFLLTRVVSASR